MNYIGEHLIFGILGKVFLTSSIVFLLISLFFYYYQSGIFKKYARISFIFHFITLLSASFVLFYIIFKHYFEYKYVWQYSSYSLPFKYVISCFWAGQEGSFLVWAFWQALLGLILIKTSKEFETYVLPVVILAQLFLLSMVAGWNIFGIQIGSSPFLLIRETLSDISGTIFSQPNYLVLLGDGNGLNPLLENIWMISHPPVLFLGYAAALIPYAYAISYLLKGEKVWSEQVYKWTIFSLIALGLGLILGGRWAYESLTFGGFWAWDPVENASLVPWMVLLAGQHLILAEKSNKAISKYSAITLIAAFVLVIYSSFLTRSGVLGSSSVHSFSSNGTSVQLLVFLVTFILLPFLISFFGNKARSITTSTINWKNKNIWLLLFVFAIILSAFQILLTTSLPVVGKILGINFAPPQNISSFYAKWQIPFAVTFCIVLIVYNYKILKSKNKKRLKIIFLISILITLVITYLLSSFYDISDFQSIMLMSFSILTFLSVILSFRTDKLAANITHLGIGSFFIGIILAFNNPQNILLSTKSKNPESTTYPGCITLIKDSIVETNKYFLKYTKQEKIKNEIFFHIEFNNKSSKKEFISKPSVNINNNFGNVNNPCIKHLLTEDIFTHIISVENAGDYKLIKETEIKLNDSLVIGEFCFIFDNIIVKQPEKDTNESNVQIIANFILKDKFEIFDSAQIMYIVKDGYYRTTSDYFLNGEYKIVFKGLSEKTNTIIIELLKQTKDVIVIKSTVFRFITILWTGVVLILFGFFLTLIKKEEFKVN